MSNDDEQHWFVSYVRTCCERKSAECFRKLGYECFLPIKRELHRWSDRYKTVERLILPHLIFVRTTERKRLESLKFNPYLTGYMSLHQGPFKPVVIPDEEMDTFRMMVEHGGNTLSVTAENIAPGDWVKIVSGPFAGRECEIVSVSGRKCMASRLGILGTALVELQTETLRKIE